MTTTDEHTSTDYGMWTEAFSRLHHAATTGASAEEIAALEAAELDELCARGERP
jgi:hypothetical protein